MTDANVVKFPVQRKANVASALTTNNDLGWLEIEGYIYDWFINNAKHIAGHQLHVHEYGFLHPTLHQVFICLIRTDEGVLCAMSNDKLSLDRFNELRQDDVIDAVIERLGYEPMPAT